VQGTLDGLLAAQRSLSDRFDDFRKALDRRDEAAYRLALADFHTCLRRWTEAEERTVLPALLRGGLAGRDPQRELRLEWIQVRELTRYLLSQLSEHAPLSDVLGFTENLARRLAAHHSEMECVYYPAAAPRLTAEEWRILGESAPPP
jgi:hypothetical protein